MDIARRGLLAAGALAGGMVLARPALAAGLPVQVGADGASPAFRAAFERLVAFARSEIEAWGFPGLSLSLLGVNGEVATAGIGYANLDMRTAVTTAQLFQIGSISKSFVAVALLRLADQGKIDLDRPILSFAPDLPVEDARVTTAYVINHVAGFPGNAPPFPHETGGKLWSGTVPGAHFHYSNSGYDMLALLIQRATGMAFPIAMRQLVFAPLDMEASEPVIRTRDRARFASGYGPLKSDRAWFPGDRLVEGSWVDIERAAGSVAATPGDMAKWMRFISACATGAAQPLLSAASARRFTSPAVAAPDFGADAKYAMGLAGFAIDDRPVLHHTGGMITFSSAMTVDAGQGGGCFASVNFTGFDGYRPRRVTAYGVRLIRALAAGTALPDAPEAAALPPVAEPGNFTGRWVWPGGVAMTIEERAGGLVVSTAGATARLRPDGPRSFRTDYPLIRTDRLDFEGESGRAERLWWGSALLGRDAAVPQPPSDPKLAALAGRYMSNDPWVGSVVVLARGQKLLVEGFGELAPHADGSWRFTDPELAAERAWFDARVNGQAQRLSLSGEPMIRQS